MKKLYFYSTPSWYKNRIDLKLPPWLKIGGAVLQTVEVRINQQDTTSNPERLECMGEFDVDFEDTEFHERLEERGYNRSREDKDREFFDITVEQAKYELEQYSIDRSKSVNEVCEELEPYDHQTYFVNKILSSWEVWKSDLEFVLFAKCRSGKSFMCLTAVDRFDKAKVTAVLSRFNSPKQSWIDDSKNYKNFSNIIGIDTQQPNWEEDYNIWSKTDKKIVLVGTIQGFHKISNLPIDLIIYDEAHIGYAGKEWKAIRKKMKCPVIYVSGTAYKLQWDFPESMKYVYTYFEEQRDKKLGIRKDVPSVKIIRRKYDTTGGKKIFGQEPDALQNIFNVGDDGEFIDRAAVQDFVISEFGVQKRVHPNQRLLRNSNHIFLTINSVPAAHAIEDVFNGTRFAPLVVTGDTKEDQKTIKKHIDNNPNGTVIITKLANVLGLTVKEIDTVINFSEGKSLEVWTQVMFRGGSSSKDWTYIDYAPERCLESLRKLYFAACDRNEEIADYKLTEYFPISDWMDGEEVLTEGLVNKILAADPSNAVRLLSGTPVGDRSLLDEVNFDIELKPTESDVIKKIGVNENDSDGKSNKIKESSKKENDRIKDVREGTVKAIKERLALVLYHEIKDGNNTCTIHSLIKSVHYAKDTGDISNILQQCLECGYEDERILNRRISQSFIDVQYSIGKDECITLDKLSHSRKDQQSIPLEVLDVMLSEITICGKLLIGGDPSGLHSLAAIKHGWKAEDIVVWENDPCHVYSVNQINNNITIIGPSLNDLEDLHMKFENINVLGNPPYSDTSSGSTNNANLDSKFYLKCVELGFYVKQIIRAKHFTDPRSTFRRKLFSSGKLKSLEYLDPDVFNIDSRIMTCIATYDHNYFGSCKIVYKGGEVRDVELTKDSLIFLDSIDKEKVENNLADRWVRGKLHRNKIDKDPDGFKIVEICGSGVSPIISTTKKGVPVAINTYGVITNVVNTVGTLGRVYLKPYDSAISSSVICLKCDSEEDATILYNYLLSEDGREVVKRNKRTAVASKEMWTYIKDPCR